jgi:hypothetical protein
MHRVESIDFGLSKLDAWALGALMIDQSTVPLPDVRKK